MANVYAVAAEMVIELERRNALHLFKPKDVAVLADMRLHGVNIKPIIDVWLASSSSTR